MKRLTLHEVTDYADFIRGGDLAAFLKQNPIAGNCYSTDVKDGLSHVLVSPDGQHIHVIVSRPKAGVLTFDKRRRHTQLHELDSDWTVSVVDVVYLDHKDGGVDVLLLVFEDGKADFWQYCEQKAGWHLLKTSELGNSPRTKVVSVCASVNCIVWCEETTSADNKQAVGILQSFNYRICMQTYDVEDSVVRLGKAKILLYNSPQYVTITSGSTVYLLPNPEGRNLRSISGFFLTWSSQCSSVYLSCVCNGVLLRKELSTANDTCSFTQLMLDGPISPLVCDILEICTFCPTGCGGLVLLMVSGWISVIENSGILRRVYKLPDCSTTTTTRGPHVSMAVYCNWLAVMTSKVLYVIDIQCGLEVQRILLKRDGVLFVNCREKHVPHFLSESGMFTVKPMEPDSSCIPKHGQTRNVRLDSALSEDIFEEARRHYQKRSLCATEMTVESLMAEGIFQTPHVLSSILTRYLDGKKDNCSMQLGDCGHLLSSMEPSLRHFVLLQHTKAAAMTASEDDLAAYREMLVREEVSRLLSSELDGEDVLHLNFMFDAFPSESWRATQVVLQLKANKEGSFSAKIPPSVWKTLLAPVQPVASRTNSSGAVALPAFELLCRFFLRFQPQWLPKFVDLAQKQAGAPLPVPLLACNYWQKAVYKDVPLYKRALSVLQGDGHSHGLNVELLLCSHRPSGVLQALRLLLDQHQWTRVLELAEKFCRQSPLLGKEIFTALLREVSQSRKLDPHLDRLWALCPHDMTVDNILEVVLESLPVSSALGPQSFCSHGGKLTVGLLRPLLGRVLQSESISSQGYAKVLGSPVFPPPVPPREPRVLVSGTSHLRSEQTENEIPLLLS